MTDSLAICFVSRTPFLSGAETALKQLAGGLAGKGHRVMVVCGRHGDAERLYRDDARLRVEVVPLCTTTKRHPLQFWNCVRRLRHLLRDHHADVLHANDIPSLQAASLAARKEGALRVSHARFLVGSAEEASWFLKYGVEKVIAVSHYLRSHLLAVAPDVFEDKVVVSHDGIEVGPPKTADDRADARRRLGIAPDRCALVFVGQFAPVKGLEELVAAIGRIDPAIAGRCSFYLVGDDLQHNGTYRREIMALAQQQAPGRDMHFPGFRRDVPDWLAAADCVVIPSRIDPLGMTAMEAMAAGRCVIATRVGGIPEMVAPDRTGWLVEGGDVQGLMRAMEMAASAGAELDERGRAGHRRVGEVFGLDKHVREVEVVYRQLLADR